MALRLLPSNEKGFVTTATVRAPSSLLISAMTGAPPVPVPPPMPAVMKTMSLPSRACLTSSMLSSAACRPTSGLAPAPSPLVRSLPNCILTPALDLSRAWASVLAAMKSTPFRLDSIMLLMAFPPPPPTPMTLIFAVRSDSTNSKFISPSSSSNPEPGFHPVGYPVEDISVPDPEFSPRCPICSME